MSSKGHRNEQIIAVTNWGSRPLGIPLRDCRTYLIIISPKANPCPSLVGVAPGYINSPALPACPTLPCGQRKPWGRKAEVFVLEPGKHVCPSCRWPPEWGGQHVGRAPIVLLHLLLKPTLLSADKDARRLVSLTGGLTALYMQNKAAGETVQLGIALGEEQAVSGFGPSSTTC